MHDASLTKTPSLAAWNGKNAFAAVPKKSSGAEVYQSTCAFHHNAPNLLLSNNGFHKVKTWSGRLHASQPFLKKVGSAAIGLHARCEKYHPGGSRACERKGLLFSIAVPFGVDMWNRRSGGQSILRSPKLRNGSLIGLSWRCYGITWIWKVL